MGYDYKKMCLNYYLSQINEKIYGNQNILKLLFHNSESPYDKKDITEEEASKKILDNPFSSSEVSKEESSQMNIFIGAGRPVYGDTDNILSENKVCFRILCHKSLYNCDYGVRPLEVVYELQKTLNDEKIGIYKMQFDMFQEVRQGDNYAGFDVWFRVLEFRRSSENL